MTKPWPRDILWERSQNRNGKATQKPTGEAEPEPGQGSKLHIGLAIQGLLDNPAGKAVLEKHIPEILVAPELSMAMGMSLEQIAGFIPDILTAEKLQAIDDDLAAV